MPSYTRIPSLSTALEQERLELLQEVQEKRKSKKPSPPRSKGDQNNHHHHIHSPSVAPSPGDLPPRHGSIAGIGVGVTPPSGRNDEPEPSSSPSTPLRATTTAVAPPPLPKPKTTTSGPPEPAARRASDQSSDTSRPAEQRPRPSIRWDASVSMSPSATGHGGHRRSLQVQEKSANRTMPGKNAMAAVMSGLDLSFNLPSFSRGRDSGRSSTRRGNSLDSRFSAPRFARSSSPKHRVVSQTPRNPAPSAMKPVVSEKPKPTEKTETESIDKDATPVPQTDAPDAPDSAVKLPTEEDQRLEKDKYDSENNPIESSEEEEDSSSSDDESPPDVTRGRSQTADRSSTDTTSELDTATSVSQPGEYSLRGIGGGLYVNDSGRP